jgi:hypothetical protein
MRNICCFISIKEHEWFEYDRDGYMYDLFGCPIWFCDYIEEYNEKHRRFNSDVDYKKLKEVRGF